MQRYIRVPALESGIIARWFEDKLGNIVSMLKPKNQKIEVHYVVGANAGALSFPDNDFNEKQILRMLGESEEPKLNLRYPLITNASLWQRIFASGASGSDEKS